MRVEFNHRMNMGPKAGYPVKTPVSKLLLTPRAVAAPQPTFEGNPPNRVMQLFEPLLSLLLGAEEPRSTWNYGIQVVGNKTRVKTWAPSSNKVELLRLKPPGKGPDGQPLSLEGRIESALEMEPDAQGNFFAELPENAAGSLYMFRLHKKDGSVSRPLPDIFSRYQPQDVHGPSQVIKLSPFKPTRLDMTPFDKRQAAVYHLHVGTFTPEGTFDGLVKKLDYIKERGYNHVKIMPVDEFSGQWNWGYDGVFKQAIENAYGTPEQFKKVVEECKKRDLRVIVDVVFNHIGPEGNYLREYDPKLLNSGGEWGDTFNWENPVAVNYVLRSLELMVQEYGVNGFRFDMSSRIPDNVMRMITTHLYKLNPNLLVAAEDDRNSNHVTLPVEHGGLGLAGKHNFAWHHRIKGLATGHSHMDAPHDLFNVSWILEEGFPGPNNPMNSLHDSVNFFESHDEIGNHDGQRTSTKIPRDRFLMASALKYAVPGIVWNFQGEESYAQTPFYFFVNHSDPQVIGGTRQGRRYSPQPDCMRPENFTDSKIKWDKLDAGASKATQELNRLRQSVPALWQGDQQQMQVDRQYLSSGVLVIRRSGKENPEDKVVIVINNSNYHYKDNYGMNLSDISESKAQDGGVIRRAFTGQNPKDWQGEWEEIFNQQDIQYGGTGWTNTGKSFKGQDNITLPANSVLIFRKKQAPK